MLSRDKLMVNLAKSNCNSADNSKTCSKNPLKCFGNYSESSTFAAGQIKLPSNNEAEGKQYIVLVNIQQIESCEFVNLYSYAASVKNNATLTESKNSAFGTTEVIEEINNNMLLNFPARESGKDEHNRRKPKKRARKPETWKRNIMKHKINHGESYINASGKEKEEKKLKEPCHDEKCSFKCTTKFTKDHRQNILNVFWKLGDINRQREFLMQHMKKIEPKYRYTKSNRDNNYEFCFEIDNKRIRVCKKFFHNTLCISDMMTRTARKKVTDDGVLEDKRGKHEKKKKNQLKLFKC